MRLEPESTTCSLKRQTRKQTFNQLKEDERGKNTQANTIDNPTQVHMYFFCCTTARIERLNLFGDGGSLVIGDSWWR